MMAVIPNSDAFTTSGSASTFVAIDFETGDHGPDSACAVGLVGVSGNEVVKRKYFLICPPRRSFFFTPVHGITWERVQGQPSFKELWPEIQKCFLGAEFIASHNASFDRRVLESCCQTAKIQTPDIPYVCTMKLARRTWDIRPSSLSNVSRYLALPLSQHDALSDAEACARIVVAARHA